RGYLNFRGKQNLGNIFIMFSPFFSSLAYLLFILFIWSLFFFFSFVYYNKQCSKLNNAFDFNVATIDEKDWFLRLDMCKKFLDLT
ncbi:Unknown protein, partial [Striga hermonthica]